MLCKGVELRFIGNGVKDRFNMFHKSIIAFVFCMFLFTSCGYKTAPVYMQTTDANISG